MGGWVGGMGGRILEISSRFSILSEIEISLPSEGDGGGGKGVDAFWRSGALVERMD